MSLLLSATQKFVAREGGNTRNKQSQLATQHCCATSCTKMLPVLLGLNAEINANFYNSSLFCGALDSRVVRNKGITTVTKVVLLS